MTNFTDLRTQLSQKRADNSAAASQLAVTREQLKQVQAQIAALRRLPGGAQREQLAALEKQAATLSANVDAQRQKVTGLRNDAIGLLGQLAALADPSKQIGEWNDQFPILLFPVRIETRFRPAQPGVIAERAVAATPAQLWIRIYPDDCQVDSFEELLTQTEIGNAQAFWAAMWRAGGFESQERGAWRTLAAGSGSGRAAYIVQQYHPQNPGDKPTKVNPQDIVLVIVAQIDVTPAEQAAAFTYYTVVWKANGDTTAEDAALAVFQGAVGNVRADAIRAGFAPDPTGQNPPKPYKRSDVNVSCAVLKLPPPPPTKTTAWTQSPKAFAMPDRFVASLWNAGAEVKRVVGNPVPDGLAVAPDPSLPPGQQISKSDDDLTLNDDLLWTADFEKAVSVGMGIKVDLSAAEAKAGFDRLLVIGLRFSADENESKQQMETLISHHYQSTHGFGLVPQGSPTNNTESDSAAYSWVDNPDAAYDVVFKGKDAYSETDDPFERRDGQWLAEALGIDDALMKRIPNAARSDQGQARAMNAALWPATLNYVMEEMMTPLFSRQDIATTRWFFTRCVSGRGPLPAVRVGKQPYGIFPAMAFSRYRSTEDLRGKLFSALPGSYLQRLHTLLTRLDADWKSMSANVAHVGQQGDAQQTLLDIVGLHSGAVEYHQRYAESLDQLFNKLMAEDGPAYGSALALWLAERGRVLLAAVGANPAAQAPILEKFFYGESPLLQGPVVDDSPLSETAPIRAYTPDKKNYIQWLVTSSIDAIRRQDFGGNPEPAALLYLFLRHALLLSQWDAGTRFLEIRSLIDPAVARLEPSFISVQSGPGAGQSKFQHLYEAQPAITGSPTTTLGEYVLLPSVLNAAIEAVDLREVMNALTFLENVPTARLERVFAEHIDCCTYRLDAWKTGITLTRLQEMRAGKEKQPAVGLYLGAFGWLENLRPKTVALSDVQLDTDLARVFGRPTDAPLKYDSTNAGYIHAPSLNHAGAAAILKNAYRVHASPANPDAMAVNLSSDRVRKAMAVLEGVRNGQTLSALLGYRFERGLHDEHNLAEVDKFIYPLRLAFPLVANQLKSTQPTDPADITLLEARNVLDGIKLINQMRANGQAYPFGLTIGNAIGQVPQATPQESLAINTEAAALLDLYDAIADLVMSESVYQVALGNFDRAAAVTNAFSQGSHPPETQIVNTPRSGLSFTHRVALHLDPNADPNTSPSTVPMTPRSQAEAPLNLWLAARFPDPADVVVRVTYTTPALAGPNTVTLSQKDLNLQPIDLLYLVNLDLDQAQSELDDRIVQVIRYGPDAHPDIHVTIQYTQAVPGKVSLLEMAALVRSLRTLLLKSRAIGPTDMALPLETTNDEAQWDDTELLARVNTAIGSLTDRLNVLVPLKTDASDLDTYASKASAAFLQTALCGVPSTGTGQIHADIGSIYDAIVTKLQSFSTRWTGKAADYEALLATYAGLTNDADRFALLRQAEGLIAASTTTPIPTDPNVYKASVATTKTRFDATLAQLNALLKFAGTKLVDFATQADALTPSLAQHDAVPFDISDQKTAITSLRATLVARVSALADDLTQRIADAQSDITTAAGMTTSQARVAELQLAARCVLGDETQIIPRFQLADDRGLEFAASVGGSAALLIDLKTAGRRFPVSDWLCGLARVRDKLNAWENAGTLSEAFGGAAADLTPVQLPFTAGDRWVALEFDPSAAGPNNRLLYTAHLAVPFDRTADQCGLLLDEWPEVVPDSDVVSGVTFHFDRPASQPPQAMLLATPSVLIGTWQWDDLVAALQETLDGSKSRGVEPGQIDGSAYAQFLPATLMAVTLYQIHIATNLAMNNRIYDVIRS